MVKVWHTNISSSPKNPEHRKSKGETLIQPVNAVLAVPYQFLKNSEVLKISKKQMVGHFGFMSGCLNVRARITNKH